MGDGLKRLLKPAIVSDSPNKLKTFRAEFHIHTVLSPCAAVEMIPPLIIDKALDKGIDLIAITDHNAIDNIPAVIEAARDTDIRVLSGIELQTREEIHSLCIFDTFDQVSAFFNTIKNTFSKIKNNSDFFGEQYVVDATGDFIRKEERLLISSSSLSLKSAWEEVNRLDGLLIPAHVNRTAFGLLPVLGFIPQDIPIEIVEISKHITKEKAVQDFPELSEHHFIQSGDAHFLDDILGLNELTIKSRTIKEINLALLGQNGRLSRIIST